MTQTNGNLDPAGSITGLEAHLGEGAPEAKGFWADAWAQVIRRPSAMVAIVWIGVVGFFAIAAPILASGHPIVMWPVSDTPGQAYFIISDTGQEFNRSEFSAEQLAQSSWTVDLVNGKTRTYRKVPRLYPLLRHLSAVDWMLLIGAGLGLAVLIGPGKAGRNERLGLIVTCAVQAGAIVVLTQLVKSYFEARDAADWARSLEQKAAFAPVTAGLIALAVSAFFTLVPVLQRPLVRIGAMLCVGLISAVVLVLTWSIPPEQFDYTQRVRDGEIRAVWTLVPWSPAERRSDRDDKLMAPGMTVDQALAKRVTTGLPIGRALSPREIDRVLDEVDRLPLPLEQCAEIRAGVQSWASATPKATRTELRAYIERMLVGSGRVFVLGSDFYGQDVLSQLLHACRLAISIGLVSTSIAVLIGVTLGALMGYFGGIVDLLLYRVVEIFMAVPLLFILIVAASVLPRNTYVTMAIIGCFTWTNAARFTRAEFLRLRNQDFVQAARGVGLPLRSVLFRHMLPNGVTPVLVDASFAIAFAIILEATLSYLGLGPEDQASWGRLLADATNEVGDFLWWLAIFPGLAIFLAALSYNLLGEALRDAIDPKLKKARV